MASPRSSTTASLVRPRWMAAAFLLASPLSGPAADAVVGEFEASGGGGGSGAVTLPVALGSLADVVGFQFDLVAAPDQATVGFPSVVSPGDHVSDSRSLEGGLRRRLTVHSPTNAVLPASLDVQVPVTLRTASPSGGPSIGLENLVFTDADGNAIPISVVYPDIEQWRRDHFTDAERLDPAIIGDDRDPDGDGLVNLGEFFGRTPPKVAAPGDAPAAVVDLDPGTGDPVLSVRFWKAKSGVDQSAEAVAEASFDLENWSRDSITVAPTGEETTTAMELEARIDGGGAADNASRLFLRLGFRRLAGAAVPSP